MGKTHGYEAIADGLDHFIQAQGEEPTSPPGHLP